jgi:hypothetical protein
MDLRFYGGGHGRKWFASFTKSLRLVPGAKYVNSNEINQTLLGVQLSSPPTDVALSEKPRHLWLHSKNRAQRQPALNLLIARTYPRSFGTVQNSAVRRRTCENLSFGKWTLSKGSRILVVMKNTQLRHFGVIASNYSTMPCTADQG